MIDLKFERLRAFNQAARVLPKGSRPNQSTWWRWWRHGVRGVRLETVIVGGKRYTTDEAVLRFVAALNAATPGTVPWRSRRTEREKSAKLSSSWIRRVFR